MRLARLPRALAAVVPFTIACGGGGSGGGATSGFDAGHDATTTMPSAPHGFGRHQAALDGQRAPRHGRRRHGLQAVGPREGLPDPGVRRDGTVRRARALWPRSAGRHVGWPVRLRARAERPLSAELAPSSLPVDACAGPEPLRASSPRRQPDERSPGLHDEHVVDDAGRHVGPSPHALADGGDDVDGPRRRLQRRHADGRVDRLVVPDGDRAGAGDGCDRLLDHVHGDGAQGGSRWATSRWRRCSRRRR